MISIDNEINRFDFNIFKYKIEIDWKQSTVQFVFNSNCWVLCSKLVWRLCCVVLFMLMRRLERLRHLIGMVRWLNCQMLWRLCSCQWTRLGLCFQRYLRLLRLFLWVPKMLYRQWYQLLGWLRWWPYWRSSWSDDLAVQLPPLVATVLNEPMRRMQTKRRLTNWISFWIDWFFSF